MNMEQLLSISKPQGLRKLRGRKGWEERKGRAGGRKERERREKDKATRRNKSYTPERQTRRPSGTAQG